MAKSYLKNAVTAVKNPPQSEPLNERQVKNSAGGYAYPVDEWTRLDRFLILGSEKGSYYASEKKLTVENVKGIEGCVKSDGLRVVNRIVEISNAGRAPKNDPALLALALCASVGDEKTRQAALVALPRVARIGTHLFHFVDYVNELRGWGRCLKSAVQDWYLAKNLDKLTDQLVKYQQRDGWSHRDVLRLAKPKFATEEFNNVIRWSVGKELTEGAKIPARLEGHLKIQKTTDPKEAAKLIRDYELVRESVPTELLTDARVWEALLEKMPITAMIRNLGNMSKCDLLTAMSDASKKVVETITNKEVLAAGRVHPIQLLIAAKTYGFGAGNRGKGVWTPVQAVVDALDEAFYLAFKNIEPTGKRFYLGLDISGSMGQGAVAGVCGLTPLIATGAMAMVTVKTEQNYYAAGFTSRNGDWSDNGMTPLKLSPKMRLDTVLEEMGKLEMGATDCALPMLDALENKLKVDTFIIYSDSETWAGKIHPTKALEMYRQKMGIPAKLAVVQMVSNGFTVADPDDGGMLDVVGFDTATPNLIADFAK